MMKFLFTPKSPKGDFLHLQVFSILTAKAHLWVWGEKHNIELAITKAKLPIWILLFGLLAFSGNIQAQTRKKVEIIHSDLGAYDQRIVANAQRLLGNVNITIDGALDPLAKVSLALFCVIVQNIRRGEDLHLGVFYRLSHLQSEQLGYLFGSLPYQVSCRVQDLSSLLAGGCRPDGKSPLGSLQGQASILARAHGHLSHWLLVGWVTNDLGFAGQRDDLFSVDKHV